MFYFFFFREVGQSKEPIRTVLKNVDPDIRGLLRKDSDVSQATSGSINIVNSCLARGDQKHKIYPACKGLKAPKKI